MSKEFVLDKKFYISKKERSVIHDIEDNAILIKDSAIKHWSKCGIPFMSWPKSGDDFILWSEFEVAPETDKFCKKCFKEEN